MEEHPAHDISIAHTEGQSAAHDRLLIRAIKATLRRHGCARARLSVALVDDACITDLNRRYLGCDRATDVLAFDLSDPSSASIRESSTVSVLPMAVEGQIVLSSDAARREAAARGHDVSAELALYAVHGTLHLLGYDDSSTQDAAAMRAMEEEILSSLGLGGVRNEATKPKTGKATKPRSHEATKR